MKNTVRTPRQKTILGLLLFAMIALSVVFGARPGSAESGTWSTRVSMPTARASLAVAVAGNTLYAFGGYEGGARSDGVEAYDTTAGTWSARASMPIPRTGPGVAEVNGKIYVFGGLTNTVAQFTTRVDVYDPATDSWGAPRAPMPTARFEFAVGVINGIIYAVGGYNESGTNLSLVEAYDPVADTWQVKAGMPTARTYVRAGVIDGMLYAVGGANGETAVEAYDPSTDTWAVKAPLPTVRFIPEVGTLGGRLYVIGGATSTFLDLVEVYDPNTNAWSTEAPMPTPRYDFGIGVAGGVLYAVGGANDSGGGFTVLPTVEALSAPCIPAWTTRTSMSTPVTQASGVVFNEKLYVMDGASNGGITTPEVYDPMTDTWSFKAPDPVSRSESAAGLINNKIYVAEGWLDSNSNTPTTALEIYDPATDSWTSGTPALIARGGSARAVIGTRLYVAGGTTSGNFVKFNDLEIYDAVTNSWSMGAPLPMAIEYPAGAAINGKFYVVGGDHGPTNENNIPSGALFIYDPASNSWSSGASMPTPRSLLAAAVIDGRLVAIGGYGSGGILSTVEIYDPVSDSWTSAPAEPVARGGHVAGVIGSNLFVAGGYGATEIDGTLDVLSVPCFPNPTPTPTPTPVNNPPVASCQNITVAAGPNCEASGSINNGSYDPDSGDTITVIQSPAGPYPIGNTTVTLTVTDNHGASSSCSATVTVVENTPPSISCPASLTVTAPPRSNSTAVFYSSPSANDACGSVVVSCSAASGSSFPVGATTVTCTATDASLNSAACSFTIMVLTPQGATQQILGAVNALVSQGTLSQGNGNALTVKLQTAINSMNKGNTLAGCKQLQAFISQTRAFINSGRLTTAQGQALIDSASAVMTSMGC
jgi:N-acetylneuraminic acid mutarotase